MRKDQATTTLLRKPRPQGLAYGSDRFTIFNKARDNAIIFATTGDDYDRIVADTSEVLRLDPNNVDAHALRAYSYQRKGDASRALADVYEVERLGAKSILAHNALSVFYNTKGDYDRALAEARRPRRSYSAMG